MKSRITGVASLVIVAVVALLPSGGIAEVTFPNTRAGEIAQAYFESLNTGDGEKIRAFEARYRSEAALARRSLDERIPGVLAYSSQLGTIDPVQIKEETATSISFICKSAKMNMYVAIKLELEETAPFKLETVQIMPASAPTTGELGEWTTLAELLALLVADDKVPALACAVIEDGVIAESSVAGVRSLGSDDLVEVNDRFHVGSVSKSMTATMIGRLVELELIDWETTVGEVLSDIDMNDAYRNVTVTQLLDHQGGVQPYTDISDEDEARFEAFEGTPTEKRASYVGEALNEEPVGPVGNYSYSNAGYSVVALMAERATGKSWEDLMREHVFDPAGMKHSGFGWPATPQRPAQPRGHFDESGPPRPQEFGEYRLGEYIAPAGDIHTSIADLANFALAHLEGLRGKDGVVKAETMARLHRVSGTSTGYVAGWIVDDSGGMGTTHWHAGSAGTFYAHVEIYPEKNRAIVVATNVGLVVGTGLVRRTIDEVNKGK